MRAAHPHALALDRRNFTFSQAAGVYCQLSPLELMSPTRPGEFCIPYDGRSPLPDPPMEAWCVPLQGVPPGAPGLVIAALHRDLYTAAWVVHAPPGGADLGSIRRRLGGVPR
jgi:hypothetical protein